MIEVERCSECDVPRQVADEHQWLDSGVIILKNDPHLRMAFAESENLDYLFDVVEELIGIPIEHLLIDIERKGTRDYFNPLIPREVKDMLKSHAIGLDPIIDALIMTNRINGLGNYDLVSYRYELDNDDYITVVSYNAYSVPLALGDMAGGCEAVVEREYSKLSHKEVTAGVYEMTAAVSGVPVELRDRLERKEYHLRKGDVALERCATCGCPSALHEFKWDLDRGTITSALNGRRMSIVHPSVIDPVFESRTDYDIFAAISERLGKGKEFTEGKSEMDWIKSFYDAALTQGKAKKIDMPEFDAFWKGAGVVEFPITSGKSMPTVSM